MPEKLPQPDENPKEKNPLDDPYSVESFAKQYEEKYGKKEDKKVEDDWNKISPEDADFLAEAGFDLDGVKETETDAGEMMEIPRKEGLSAFVKKENVRDWIQKIKDEQELSGLRKDVEKSFGEEGSEKLPENLESMTKEELAGLKDGFYNLAESVKRLYAGLYERNGESL